MTGTWGSVDQHAREAVAGCAARVGVLMQRADRGEQQVVEDEPVGLGEHRQGPRACAVRAAAIPGAEVAGARFSEHIPRSEDFGAEAGNLG